MSSLWSLALAAGLAGALAIWGKHPGRMWVHFVCKPLTLLVIIGITVYWPTRLSPLAYAVLLVALGLSCLGDVALMFARAPLVLGLAIFLAAHVAYVVTFSLGVAWAPGQLVWLALPLVIAGLVLRSLWPHLGRLRAPVAVYVGVLVLVVWRLWSRFDLRAEIGAAAWLEGGLGALLFMASDSLLARRRLAHRPVPYALELGCYFVAQWCMCQSTWQSIG